MTLRLMIFNAYAEWHYAEWHLCLVAIKSIMLSVVLPYVIIVNVLAPPLLDKLLLCPSIIDLAVNACQRKHSSLVSWRVNNDEKKFYAIAYSSLISMKREK